MNEHTQKLLEQATYYILGVRLVDQKKFAELIVKECVAVGSHAWLADNSTVPTFPAKQIKEHFGVEE